MAHAPDLVGEVTKSLSNLPERRDSARLALLSRFAWFPIPAALIAIIILAVVNPDHPYESVWLVILFNSVSSVVVSLLVAWLLGSSALVRCTPSVLVLTLGVLTWGAAGLAGPLFLTHDVNSTVTIHNTLACFSACFHVLSAVLVWRGGRALSAAGFWLASTYAAAIALIALALTAVTESWMPIFFVQGQGGTPFRQLVLGTAVGMFILAACLLRLSGGSTGSFNRWYSLALALYAVGLLGVMLQSSVATALGWTGRSAQYLGGIYMLIAAITAVRDTRAWQIPLDRALERERLLHHESESRYRSLFQTMTEGFAVHEIITDQAGRPSDYRFLDVNPAFERLTGLRRDDVLGKRVSEVLPSLESVWIESYGRVALTGEPLNIESFSGALGRWYQVFAYRTAPGRFAVLFSDITKRKQAEAALAAAHARTQRILESITEGYYALDCEWRFVAMNRVAEQHFKQPATELIGKNIWQVTQAPVESLVHRKFREAKELGRPLEFEAESLLNPGKWWVLFLYPREGGLEIYFHEITDRKQAEEALRESEEKFHSAIANAAIGFAMTTPDGRFVDANPAYRALTGFTMEELQELEFEKLIHPEDRPENMRLIGRMLGGELADFVVENRYIRKNGEAVWVRKSVSLVRKTDGSPRWIIALTEDITSRKMAETELKRANEQLEEKVRERTTELARRAEQLRALAGELTLTEQRERRRLAKFLHDHLQQLLVGAKFRTAILGRSGDELTRQGAAEIQSILDECIKSSRSLTAELSPPILHEGSLRAGLEWLARWMADKYGLIVDLSVENDLPPLLEDVRVLLFESVRELLFNSVKHARVASVNVHVRQVGERELRVTVSDNGQGFDPSGLDDAHNGGKFGLFSIRERVHFMRGNFEIDSTPGVGSRFILTVPVTDCSLPQPVNLPKMDRMDVRTEEARRAGAVRVLLVDDHAVMREGLARLLGEEAGIDIVGEAADGQEAIGLADRLKPDVILMDMSMPRLNGLEATRMIHRANPGIRIIGLSMAEEAESARAMLEAGAVAYLSKTAPSTNLISTILATE